MWTKERGSSEKFGLKYKKQKQFHQNLCCDSSKEMPFDTI